MGRSEKITILNFDQHQRKGARPLITSPRSLLACEKEGILPEEDLVVRPMKDFLASTKGNVEAAKIKAEHYADRRAQLIDVVIQRREAIIAAQSAAQQDQAHPADSSSPTSARTDALSVPRSQSAMSPEEFQKVRAAEQRRKALRQVERMQHVLVANAQREKRQAEFLRRAQEKLELQEQQRQREKEERETEQRIREAQARKREGELIVQRQLREAQQRAYFEEQRRMKEEKLTEMEQKDAERRRREEEARALQELEFAEKQQLIALRQDAILRQAEDVQQQRAEMLRKRMEHAEEQRRRLKEKQEAEMSLRKMDNEKKTEENKMKRERALAYYESKITRYKEKGAAAEQKRKELEEQRRNYAAFQQLEEQRREEARRQKLANVEQAEKVEAEQLVAQLEEAEARAKKILEEKREICQRRAVEKELIVEDRALQVQRFKRMIDAECKEAALKLELKMKRIEELRHTAQEADEERKKILVSIEKQKRPRKPEWTPGPNDYDTTSAEQYLFGTGPRVKLATSGRTPLVTNDAHDTPGPGQYVLKSALKKRGAKLPPKPLESPSASLQVSQQRKERTVDGALPPIAHASSSHPAADSAIERPPGVNDEDYDSAEDFDPMS